MSLLTSGGSSGGQMELALHNIHPPPPPSPASSLIAVAKKRGRIENDNEDGQVGEETLTKKRRCWKESSQNSTNIKNILDLSDDAIGSIFEFLPGSFLYLAGTCKKFLRVHHQVYNEMVYDEEIHGSSDCHDGDGDNTDGKNGSNSKNNKRAITTTSWSSVMESISRVQHYLRHQGSSRKNLIKMAKSAAHWGNSQMLEYVMAQQPPSISFSFWDDEEVVASIRLSASFGGRLHILKHSKRKTKLPWPKGMLDAAIITRHMHVIRWLLQDTDCSREAGSCLFAIIKGDLEVLQCLRCNGCPWKITQFMAIACSFGHLEIVKWIRQNGCRWHVSYCESAAICGHLNVLKWAIEDGCPWIPFECRASAEAKGHMEIVNWIDENNG